MSPVLNQVDPVDNISFQLYINIQRHFSLTIHLNESTVIDSQMICQILNKSTTCDTDARLSGAIILLKFFSLKGA